MLAKLENGLPKVAGGKILKNGNVTITNPREEDFIAAGYKPVEDNRLEEREGYYQVAEYTETDDKIVATYHYEEIPNEQEINA